MVEAGATPEAAAANFYVFDAHGLITTTRTDLTEEQTAFFQDLFSQMDKDGNGEITATELREALDLFGIKVSPDEAHMMVMQADTFAERVAVRGAEKRGTKFPGSLRR